MPLAVHRTVTATAGCKQRTQQPSVSDADRSHRGKDTGTGRADKCFRDERQNLEAQHEEEESERPLGTRESETTSWGGNRRLGGIDRFRLGGGEGLPEACG